MKSNSTSKLQSIIIFLILCIALAIITSCQPSLPPVNDPSTIQPIERHILSALPHDASLHPLPSPKFVSIKEADQFLGDNDQVLAIKVGEEQKIYPLKILLWHELVNDNISSTPIVVTYCPLCGSANIYERTITKENQKKVLQFENTGKVLDISTIFRDIASSSLFLELNGTAIEGDLATKEIILKKLDSSIVYYRDWKTKYPKTQVLSLDTGSNKPYGTDPYIPYYTNREIPLQLSQLNGNLHPKEPVIGIKIGSSAKAYKESDIKRLGTISDTLAGVSMRIQIDETGSIQIIKKETGEILPKTRAYWYVWAAHHPDTTIYMP